MLSRKQPDIKPKHTLEVTPGPLEALPGPFCRQNVTVFPKTCPQMTLGQSQWPGEISPLPWLGEYAPSKHMTGTSPAGCHVSTEQSS